MQRIIFTASLLVTYALYPMEPVDTRIVIPNENSALTTQLISAIKAGQITNIHTALTSPQTRTAETNATPQDLDQLIQALGYTKGEIAVQESQMAKKVFDTLTTRYRQMVIPFGICIACLANIGVSGYNFATGTAQTNPSLISFGFNMTASGLAALGFGYETWLQCRKGWTDHRQKKLIQQLQNSELLLQLLQASALKDGVISAFEQAAIEKAQIQNVNLQVQLAQATIDAQNANSTANNNLALKAPETPQPAITQTKSISKKNYHVCTAEDNNLLLKTPEPITSAIGTQSRPLKKKKKRVRKTQSTGQVSVKKLE